MSSQKMMYLFTVAALVLGLSLTGCSSKNTDSAQQGVRSEGGGATESLESADTGIMEGRTSGPMVPVYFEFDSSKIAGEQVQRIATNADFLKKNPQIKIRIEGNCDERGTAEYNLALGDRRAKVAKDFLVNLGIRADRISTISYGEERPKYDNSREETRRLNRRAALVVRIQ